MESGHVEQKQKIKAIERCGPSMVHYKGFIFIIAGCNYQGGQSVALNTVDLYEISGDQSFRPAPKLNEARLEHSSCVLGHHIYTFGGEKSK